MVGIGEDVVCPGNEPVENRGSLENPGEQDFLALQQSCIDAVRVPGICNRIVITLGLTIRGIGARNRG